MFLADNQIAEFRESIYKNGFGFSVSVVRNEDETVKVQSENLLNETYENFETFLDDLILKNPLLQKPMKLTTSDRFKLTTLNRLKLTSANRLKLTT